MRKIVALFLSVMIALAVFVPMVGATPAPTPSAAPVFQMNGTAPKYEQGETIGGFNIAIQDIGLGTKPNATEVRIEMVTNSDITKFPFEIAQQSYISDILTPNGDTYTYSVPSLRVRGDAAVGYYDIPVRVYYRDNVSVPPATVGTPQMDDMTFRVFVGPKPGSAASDGVTHIPKVIISGFSTNPKDVVAGEDFVLNVTFKNTSKDVAIANLKAALTSSDSTFTPVSGSSTLFIESLAPGATKAVTIKLHVKADAAPNSYSASFALSYDAVGMSLKDNASVTDTEVVAIPVKQVPKVQVSTMQVSPSEIFVNNDVNVMTSVNNTGKATVYNVNVKITDTKNLFVASEQYLGNLLTGASGAVDLYVTPQTLGATTLQMNVTYEDENGTVFNSSQTFDVTIMDKTDFGGISNIGMPEMPIEQGGVGWWVWIVLAAVVAIIATVILLKRKRAKARVARDRMEAKRLEEEYFRSQARSKEGIR